MFCDVTFFITLPGFLNNRSKESTKWSDSNISATVRLSTPVARFMISQSKVWPRRWVGTLINCSKLRLPSKTFRAAVQGSEGLSKWTLRSPTTNSLSQETYDSSRSENCSKNIAFVSLFFLLGGSLLHTDDFCTSGITRCSSEECS